MRTGQIAGVGAMTQPAGIDVVKRQEEAAEVMFADMIAMNGSADVDNFAADVADEMVGSVEKNDTDSYREKPTDVYEKYQYKDKSIRTKTSDDRPEKLQEAVEEVEEFEEAVTEVLAEELHVSKEELEAAMEELGLTYLDLLNNGNLAALVAKLTGSENVNQLLCDETFMNVLQQVKALGTEFLQEVQLTPEELSELQEVMKQNETSDLQVEEEPELADAELHTEETADDVVKVEVIRTEETEKQESFSEDGEEQSLSDMTGKQTAQTHISQGNENVVVDSTQPTTFEEHLNGFETVQELPPHVTVADIMEQFAEQVRVQISADTTKMQMQLNPEHLGKLYVEIIENEGAITAKIETQNLEVKEALEMQMADLKVNLSQAGVKVDSVEVTIASHEFERNLEQDANSKKQQEDAETKTTTKRNINLNGLDELSGLMTEEEELVAKMMAEQGNSVDFTA
ncbi:MAG: flagellar hook-length control protein FliK [Roseburia sp.]|nr:flagellar hook-length control protein FliK [Roseburia sp.]